LSWGPELKKSFKTLIRGRSIRGKKTDSVWKKVAKGQTETGDQNVDNLWEKIWREGPRRQQAGTKGFARAPLAWNARETKRKKGIPFTPRGEVNHYGWGEKEFG